MNRWEKGKDIEMTENDKILRLGYICYASMCLFMGIMCGVVVFITL